MKNLLNEHFKVWKETLAALGFFALMAILVPKAKAAHMGTGGEFLAMMLSAAIITALYFGGGLVRKRLEESPLKGERLSYFTGRELVNQAVGSTDDVGETALVAIDPATVQLAKTTVAFNRYDEAALDLVEEAEQERRGEPALENDLLPDRIIEENPLYLSETFQPDVTSLIGAMLLLIGMRRSGKSNATAVLIEELARWLLPMVIFDTMDEHRGLLDTRFLRRGVHAGSMDLLQGKHDLKNYVPIDIEGAYEFGQSVMEGSLQVVVNLASFDDETAGKVMSEMIDGINDWEQARPNKQRVPVIVVLEEAPKWLPQNLGDSSVSKATQALLHQAFFGIVVARGGKNGFGLIATAQRYSMLNKHLLQPLWQLLFFQKAENDVDRYMKLGLPRGATMSLQQGECFIFGPTVLGFRTMIRQRYSEHMGHTPGIDALIAHHASVMPVPMVLNRSFARENEHTGMGTIYGYQGTRTERLSQGLDEHVDISYHQGYQRYPEMSAVPQEREPRTSSRTSRQLSPQLQLALVLYHQGATTMFGLAAAMTADGRFGMITSEQAAEMINQLKAMGWIEQEPSSQSSQRPTQLEQAVQAYKEGFTSIDKLAIAINVSVHTARRLMSEMKVKRLV
jgi:hypothetical protein